MRFIVVAQEAIHFIDSRGQRSMLLKGHALKCCLSLAVYRRAQAQQSSPACRRQVGRSRISITVPQFDRRRNTEESFFFKNSVRKAVAHDRLQWVELTADCTVAVQTSVATTMLSLCMH